jgi:L-aminopeptidase/D-esterase-like protein
MLDAAIVVDPVHDREDGDRVMSLATGNVLTGTWPATSLF